MIRALTTLVLVVAIALSCPAQGGVVEPSPLAFESFDYLPNPTSGIGAETGGHGWLVPWWSGTLNTATQVLIPGFDAVGGKVRTQDPNVGSYRVVDAASWPNQAVNVIFGDDGTTVWLSFMMQRVPGSDDQWGGVSLFEQFIGEKLFVGSPYQTNELGIRTYGPTGAAYTIPGTTPDALTTIVVRIDFMTGSERVRMWTNPGVPFPDFVAPIDVMADDFVWNEVRIASGSPNTMTGYEFDAVKLDLAPGQLAGSATNMSASTGGLYTLTLDVGVTFANLPYLIGGSSTATFPGIPYGPYTIPLVWDSYTDFTLMFGNNGFPYSNFSSNLDVNGFATATITLPPGLFALVGQTFHHGAVIHDGTGTLLRVTNPVPVTIDP